jgi:hypothetical protein
VISRISLPFLRYSINFDIEDSASVSHLYEAVISGPGFELGTFLKSGVGSRTITYRQYSPNFPSSG